MTTFDPELSRLVDLAVLGSERTAGRERTLWLRLLDLLLKLAGL